MQRYETTIVIDSLQKADDMQVIVTKVESFITNHGGTIINKDEWGKKRLAYEINRKQYGNYYHLLFEGPGTIPLLLEREYRLEESILRYLTVKAEPRNYPEKPEGEEAAAADPEAQPAATESVADPEPQPVVAEPATDPVAAEEASVQAETAVPVEQEAETETESEPEPKPKPEAAAEAIDPVAADNEAEDKTAD